MRMLTAALVGTLALSSPTAQPQDQNLTLGSWNIEHLGTSGRGFGGGFGGGNLPLRTNDQLRQVAQLIRDTIHADVLVLQEIAVSRIVAGASRSDQLDTIVSELGAGWDYFLPPVGSVPTNANNMHNGLLWNGNRVNMLKAFAMDLPDDEMAGEPLFKRQPIVGYFEALNAAGDGTNDFVMIGVHLASGQQNDENHIIAMVLLEHSISAALAANQIRESDRIILGDFNDNPYAVTNAGNQRSSTALYTHMQFKRYEDLVTKDSHSTRMDANLRSVIDHVLVNNSVRSRHTDATEADIFLPGGGDSSTFAQWRFTFSDHFPITFPLDIENSDDDADFQ